MGIPRFGRGSILKKKGNDADDNGFRTSLEEEKEIHLKTFKPAPSAGEWEGERESENLRFDWYNCCQEGGGGGGEGGGGGGGRGKRGGGC